MKIEKIELKNYKAIKSLILVVDGKNLAITGSTGAGKTTVISSLWELLELVGEPITKGEKKGKIKITLSDKNKKIFAERNFTQKTKNIKITSSIGEAISVKEFKSWFSSLANNPQDILKLSKDKMIAKLLESVNFPKDFNLQEVESNIEKYTILKNDLTKELNFFKNQIEEEPEKVERIDINEKMEELKQAQETRQQVINKKNESEFAKKRNIEIQEQIEKLKNEILLNEKTIENNKMFLFGIEDNLEAIQKEVNNISETNARADKYSQWQRRQKQIEWKEAELKKAKEALLENKEKRKDGMKNADWPLPNITLENGIVYYKGVPFEQAGDSEKMLISGALAAEQIKNKPLKIVRMDGIESMSKEDFEKLRDIFNKNDIQVLSTRVMRNDAEENEIIINEGKIINKN